MQSRQLLLLSAECFGPTSDPDGGRLKLMCGRSGPSESFWIRTEFMSREETQLLGRIRHKENVKYSFDLSAHNFKVFI